MVDFAMDVHKSLYPDQEVPATLVEKRAQVVEQFKQLQSETDTVLKIDRTRGSETDSVLQRQ